jgi:hemolysin activation/secretion protein
MLAVATATAQSIDPSPVPLFDASQQLKELFEPNPKSAPRSEVVIPDRAKQLDASTAGITVVPRVFELEGVTAIDARRLAELYQPHIGQATSIEELFLLARAMTRVYRNAGYVLAEIIVPPQRIDIEHGIVRLEAIEGYVSSVEIEGDEAPPVVRSYLDKITHSRPLHIDELERYLLLANDVPGYQLRTVLAPADAEPGSSKLRVEVKRTRLDGAVALSNSGTETVGTYRGSAYVSYNGLTGRGERTDFGYETATDFDELQQFSLAHSELLGTEGTQLQVSGSWSKVQPGAELTPYDVVGTLWQGELSVSRPIVRRRSSNLAARVGVGTISNTSSIISVTQFDDRYPYAFVNLSYDVADSHRGLSIVSFDLRQGLDTFDARVNGRVGAQPDFALAKVYAGRNQGIAHGVSVYAAAFAQHAFSDLPAAEEISFGGRVLGRGYDRSEIAADDGIGAKLEVRYAPPSVHPLQPAEIYTFYDWAKVREHTDGEVLANGKRTESLSSFGIGAKMRLGQSISGLFEAAKPLTKGVSSDDGRKAVRISFELRATF